MTGSESKMSQKSALTLKGYLLLLLNELGGKLEGETRFQKFAFLGKKEFGLPLNFTFTWGNYGPFSRELREDLLSLHHDGLLTFKREKRVSPLGDPYFIKTFSLTDQGRDLIKISLDRVPDDDLSKLRELVETFGYLPLKEILRYVYKLYSPKDLEG